MQASGHRVRMERVVHGYVRHLKDVLTRKIQSTLLICGQIFSFHFRNGLSLSGILSDL